MAEFVSMYRKDYLWPKIETTFPRMDLSCRIAVPNESESKPNNHLPICPIDWEEKLEESKIIKSQKVRFSDCSNDKNSHKNENNDCLKKLMDENPNLFNVLRKVPTSDAVKKFNLERLKTIYQVDYDHMEDDIPKDLKPIYRCPLDETGSDEQKCRQIQRSRKALMRLRYGLGYEPPGKPCCTIHWPVKRKNPGDEPESSSYKKKKKSLPPWTSEYRDIINKTAMDIIRETKMEARRKSRLKNFKGNFNENNNMNDMSKCCGKKFTLS